LVVGVTGTGRPHERLLPLVPEFQFARLEATAPPFGQPVVTARFTQPLDLREPRQPIVCEPAVAFTTTPEPWRNGVCLTGPFEHGRT
jgi:hypothetical protein